MDMNRARRVATTSASHGSNLEICYAITPGPSTHNNGWVVLVHGSLQSKSIWDRYGYTDALAQHHHVVTVDVLGHGDSSKPRLPQRYAMKYLVDDIRAVLDEIGVQSVHYMGYSLGGRIGLAMAANRPERLASLVILGSSHHAQHDLVDAFFFPGAADILETGGMSAFLAGWQTAQNFTMSRASFDRFIKRDPFALAAYLRSLPLDSGISGDRMSAIKLPTLICAGTNDALRFDESIEATNLIPGSQFFPLAGKNHAQTITDGAAEVLDRVTAFFQSTNSADFDGARIQPMLRTG
jgi:pimeloyl-ACP methyl ester carboxylesterase